MWTETPRLHKPQSTAPEHPHLSDYKIAQTCLSSWHLLILAYFMVPGLWPGRARLPCCTLSSCKKNWTRQKRTSLVSPSGSLPGLSCIYGTATLVFSFCHCKSCRNISLLYLLLLPSKNSLLGARYSWLLYADFILSHWSLPLIN
jgi:hypothetical protein